jgi:hypothetical protein
MKSERKCKDCECKETCPAYIDGEREGCDVYEKGGVMNMDSVLEIVFVGFLVMIALALMLGFYFLPTIIAAAMHNYHLLPIFLLNLFAGWTGFGWLGALIWAVII